MKSRVFVLTAVSEMRKKFLFRRRIKKKYEMNYLFRIHILNRTNKAKSIIVTEVTVRSPFITFSRLKSRNFLDMEVIMLKKR